MKKKYSTLNHYSYMIKHLCAYSPKLSLCVVAEIITNALQPLTGAVLPAFIVGLLEKRCDIKTLIIACLTAFLGVGILSAAASFLSTRNRTHLIFLRLERFETIILRKSLTIDYVLYESEAVQDSLNKASGAAGSNLSGVEGFYHHNTTLFTSLVGLALYSIIISNVHPLLVILLLSLSVIQFFFYRLARSYEDKHRREQSLRFRHQRYLFNQSSDVKVGKDIRLFQLQDWLTSLIAKYNHDYQKQMGKSQSLFFLYDFVGLVLTLLRDGISYGYLIYLLTQGMDVSQFVLYLGVVSGFGNWFGQISEMVARISGCLKDIDYFREYEEINDIYLHNEGKILNVQENSSVTIDFEDVSFCYPGSERSVLDHVSFHIDSGEKIALVGINGAGKTTMVKMLCGFYRPTGGKILINGVDITELNIEKYFDQVSVLFQDSITLSYTIAQNITGQTEEKMDRSRLHQVLKRSGLAEKVHSLPKKEDTFIGKDVEDEGLQLSGGQIQKLFLARALYKNAFMLILDEPTAALDAIAESNMYQQYNELVEHKTSFFISHRLSSTRFCDRIFFLENGKIKESGSHEELMKQNGSYANMFRIQSRYYVKEESNEAV